MGELFVAGERGALAGYRGTASLRGWLSAVLFNRWRKSGRRTAREVPLVAEVEPTATAPSPLALASDAETTARFSHSFLSAWDVLTEREREVLYALRRGRTQRDVARGLGISESRVSALVRKGSSKLAARLREFQDLRDWDTERVQAFLARGSERRAPAPTLPSTPDPHP